MEKFMMRMGATRSALRERVILTQLTKSEVNTSLLARCLKFTTEQTTGSQFPHPQSQISSPDENKSNNPQKSASSDGFNGSFLIHPRNVSSTASALRSVASAASHNICLEPRPIAHSLLPS
jgi:hypothetical protein